MRVAAITLAVSAGLLLSGCGSGRPGDGGGAGAAVAAQADPDAMAVDHEYRVAMLELGMTDDTTTDTTT